MNLDSKYLLSPLVCISAFCYRTAPNYLQMSYIYTGLSYHGFRGLHIYVVLYMADGSISQLGVIQGYSVDKKN